MKISEVYNRDCQTYNSKIGRFVKSIKNNNDVIFRNREINRAMLYNQKIKTEKQFLICVLDGNIREYGILLRLLKLNR